MKKLVFPVKNLKLQDFPKGDITQWFGQNPSLYARFNLKGHNGIDIVRPHGEPMYAIEDAIVVDVNNDPQGFGRHVRIVGTEKNEAGYHNEWIYGHCDKITVNVNNVIKAGDMVATMGNTGFVVSGNTPFWRHNPFAGTHLHLGLRHVRPNPKGWSYPGSTYKLSVVNSTNGYKGSIDSLPLLLGIFVPPPRDTIKEMQLTVISLARTLLTKMTNK